MSEVWNSIKIRPKLTPLSGEELHNRKSNNSNNSRLEISGNKISR